MFDAFLSWSKVLASIDDQVLERADGAVSIRFNLENGTTAPIAYVEWKAEFVAGEYESHPSGDTYTIEGDDRSIAIWFSPAGYYDDPAIVHIIPANHAQSFTAQVEVPPDLPNPVEVSICLPGPFVEAGTLLGKPRKLAWIQKNETNAAQAGLE